MRLWKRLKSDKKAADERSQERSQELAEQSRSAERENVSEPVQTASSINGCFKEICA